MHNQAPHITEEQQRDLVRIIHSFRDKRDPLISILQALQSAFGYIPEEAVEEISKVYHIPPATIFGVASFYTQLSFEPQGRHTILSCQGTACHIRGSGIILEEMKRNLAVEEDGTTQDGRFTLKKVFCVGCCSLAPAVVVDDTVYGKLAPGETEKLLKKYP